jgi:hypothetical protein
MSGKCKDGVYGIPAMDLIILNEMAPTWKDVNCRASSKMHVFWGREFE